MNKRVPKVGLIRVPRKTGTYWRLRYKLPNKKKYIYENLPKIPKRDAQLIQATRQNEFMNGVYQLSPPSKVVIPLQRLLDEYYSTRQDLGIRTLKKYKSYTNRFAEFILNNFVAAYNDISIIKHLYVNEFLTKTRDKDYQDETWSEKNCNGARAVLQMIFDYAAKHKYVTENPIKEIKPFRIPERTTNRVISDREFKIIFKNLPPHWVGVFKFLLHTGLRNSELVNLKWNNFHEVRKKGKDTSYYIDITSSDEFTTKTKKSRKIPLNKEALTIINKRKGKHSTYIFTTSFNEKISENRLRKVLLAVQENLGTNYRVHDFRHTFGSKLAANNISIYKISELLGHSVDETTRLYAHLQSEDLQSAVDTIKF